MSEDPARFEIGPALIRRSEPQISVLVILTSTLVGHSIFASGTLLTLTSRALVSITAFFAIPLNPSLRTCHREEE
jgi:hypothetical protein